MRVKNSFGFTPATTVRSLAAPELLAVFVSPATGVTSTRTSRFVVAVSWLSAEAGSSKLSVSVSVARLGGGGRGGRGGGGGGRRGGGGGGGGARPPPGGGRRPPSA